MNGWKPSLGAFFTCFLGEKSSVGTCRGGKNAQIVYKWWISGRKILYIVVGMMKYHIIPYKWRIIYIIP